MDRYMVSPFDLSRTIPVGGGLLVPCSLPGPPVNSCKWLLWCLARVGSFSQCASPNNVKQNYHNAGVFKAQTYSNIAISEYVCM